jgi:hypothetical protein
MLLPYLHRTSYSADPAPVETGASINMALMVLKDRRALRRRCARKFLRHRDRSFANHIARLQGSGSAPRSCWRYLLNHQLETFSDRANNAVPFKLRPFGADVA